MSNTITVEDLMTYGMWAEFLHGLQNYRYPQISVGGSGLRNGTNYTDGNINQVLAGEYNGSLTRPLLNRGNGNGMQSMPLGMFKDVTTDSGVPGLDGWLRTFRSLLIDNALDYPPGGNPDGNRWRLSEGATTMYLQAFPYISVNQLKKSGQWLNLNSQPNPPTQYSVSGVDDSLDNKGAQYSLFSRGKSDTRGLTFENATLELGLGKSTTIKKQKPREAGVSVSFLYIPGSGQKLEISKEITTELTTQQTQGTRYKHSETLSDTFKISDTFKEGLSIDVPEVGKASAENSTTIENSITASFTRENEISASNQKTTKTTEKNTIKYNFDPGAFKEGSSIGNLGTLIGNAKLKNPDQKLISGERYRASFIYDTASVSIPGDGYQKIYGTAAPIEPRSMQYQAVGTDLGTMNWFERSDTTPDGRLVGKQAYFIAQKFLDFAGKKAYGIEDFTNVTRSNNKIEKIPTFIINSDSSFSSLAVVNTTTDISFNILLDISKEHSSAGRLAGNFANALQALQAKTELSLDNVYDLEANGQSDMSEHYIGDAGSDYISGTSEGDDYAHTDSGDDVIVGFNNSFIDSGDGNDIISMGSKDSQNFIDAGSGNDTLKLESIGNVVNMGSGSDTATIVTGNSVDLGLDQDKDTLKINSNPDPNSQKIYIENLDIGRDLIILSAPYAIGADFTYDSVYKQIVSQKETPDQEFAAWIHPDEDLNINHNDHRLFLQLLSSSDLTAADRVFIETDSLSDAQWDAFIKRFVFSDQPLNTADAQNNAFMAADLKELLNNPDLQSLGRAIWEAASSAGESALKTLITAKLIDLGIPETAATDVVNSSWAIMVGLLEQSVTDANALATPSDTMFSSAAETFLIEVSSRMEEIFHAKAFPTEQIDPLTGLSIMPSPDDNTITATDSNDWIRGGSGDDLIDSGAGNDAVRLGTGSDRISLGAGADALIISYDQMDGVTDTVTDFNAAEDRLLLEEGIQIEQLSGDRFRLFTNGNMGEEQRELTLLLEGGGANLATLNVERFSFG